MKKLQVNIEYWQSLIMIKANNIVWISYLSSMFLLVFVTSCDIPGYMVIVNKTGSEAAYVVYFKENSSYQDTFNIVLSGTKDSSTATLIYGFGQFWTDERIVEYVNTIDKVELITPKDTVVLRTESELMNFYKERRGGIFKETIKITFK